MIRQASSHPELQAYRVQVGHASVVVRCDGPEEALREGRRQLSLEMPRLWDVIHNLDASRFDVQQQR